MYVLINIEGMARRKGGVCDIYPAYASDTWIFPSNESDGLHTLIYCLNSIFSIMNKIFFQKLRKSIT
jgi:hypothetical protein